MEVGINWLAILVCAILSIVVGAIWYGPLFGKIWMQMMGVDMSTVSPEKMKEMQKSSRPLYVMQFLASLLTVYIFAFYVKGWQPQPGIHGGIINGFFVWLGFVMPTIAGQVLWSGKTKKMILQSFLVSSGYQLLMFVIFGTILSIW
jgi:hypothetical protein